MCYITTVTTGIVRAIQFQSPGIKAYVTNIHGMKTERESTAMCGISLER